MMEIKQSLRRIKDVRLWASETISRNSKLCDSKKVATVRRTSFYPLLSSCNFDLGEVASIAQGLNHRTSALRTWIQPRLRSGILHRSSDATRMFAAHRFWLGTLLSHKEKIAVNQPLDILWMM